MYPLEYILYYIISYSASTRAIIEFRETQECRATPEKQDLKAWMEDQEKEENPAWQENRANEERGVHRGYPDLLDPVERGSLYIQVL